MKAQKESTTLTLPEEAASSVQPYVFFNGRCAEAAAFYQKALGAEIVTQLRFGDHPQAEHCEDMPENWGDKVMHMELRIGGSRLLASDGCGEEQAFKGFGLSLSSPDDAETRRRFEALAVGGQVGQPLDKTFFASSFGMVTDRFGLLWLVITPAKE